MIQPRKATRRDPEPWSWQNLWVILGRGAETWRPKEPGPRMVRCCLLPSACTAPWLLGRSTPDPTTDGEVLIQVPPPPSLLSDLVLSSWRAGSSTQCHRHRQDGRGWDCQMRCCGPSHSGHHPGRASLQGPWGACPISHTSCPTGLCWPLSHTVAALLRWAHSNGDRGPSGW